MVVVGAFKIEFRHPNHRRMTVRFLSIGGGGFRAKAICL
jgi:hypothetical protein